MEQHKIYNSEVRQWLGLREETTMVETNAKIIGDAISVYLQTEDWKKLAKPAIQEIAKDAIKDAIIEAKQEAQLENQKAQLEIIDAIIKDAIIEAKDAIKDAIDQATNNK